jgi:hypothetical protein
MAGQKELFIVNVDDLLTWTCVLFQHPWLTGLAICLKKSKRRRRIGAHAVILPFSITNPAQMLRQST